MEHKIDAFFFDTDDLYERAEYLIPEYRDATPFPHVVIRDLVPESVLNSVRAEFPRPAERDWHGNFDNANERKLAEADEERMGPATRALLNQLNAAPMLNFLERLTGIEQLLSDPHFTGGGLHQIEPGGYLKVHADFSKHNRINHLDRRLNLLLYLNEDWQDAWGGHLELWDRSMTRCVTKVAPTAGTVVIFPTTSVNYHGHPDPLACPPSRTRQSLATYYYTIGRDDQRATYHSTLFQKRPSEAKVGWRDFVPPIAETGTRKIRSRLRRA